MSSVVHSPATPPTPLAVGGSVSSRFEVVFVCTGNRTRSPLAAALCRRDAAGLDVHVRSVGTLDLGSVPALPETMKAARELAVDLAGHRTQSLNSAADLSAADLVLGFEPFHVTAAVDAGAHRARTFLLGEFVALLDPAAEGDGSAGQARVTVERAHLRRRSHAKWFPTATIADPLGGPPSVLLATAHEIDELVGRLVRALFGLADGDARSPER